MQKPNRLLLAVLALVGSSAALAQSSVTLYGRVNTSVERQKVGNATTTALSNNASRFGFKGVEDLGGGLKAGFQLESGFDSSTGAGSGTGGGLTFGRQSEVNLSGGFGMIRLGTWIPESYFAVADYGVLDEPNHETGNASDALYQYVMRDSNKVGYRTPDFGGLTVEAAASLHENTPVTGVPGNKNAYDLAANWEGGALALGAGYTKIGDSNQVGIRVHYTAGPFQVGGYFQRTDGLAAANEAYSTTAGKRNLFRVTGGYTFGASQVALGFGKAGDVGNVANSDAKQFIVGYNYNLSKRTKVYAIYTKVDNNSAASYKTGTAGVDFSTYGVGVRHNF